MPSEQARRQARERAAEIRRKAGGKGAMARLTAARPGTGGFVPAVSGESVEAMAALAEEHGCEFVDYESLYLAAKNRSPDFTYGFPSPGGYEMHVSGPVPRELRDVLEEAARARVRGGDGPLLPDWLRGRLPEMEADGMAQFGSLPEDRLYLLRTPGGVLAVTVDRGRDEGLHRAMWGTGDLKPLDLIVTFAPDGTPEEAHSLRLAFSIAHSVLLADACDWRSIPGTDVQELREQSIRVKALENSTRKASVRLYNHLVQAFIGQYGAPDPHMPPEGDAAEEMKRRLREIAVAYRDREYADRRRRAAELAKAGTPWSLPVAPEKPRRTFAELVYEGLYE